MTPRNRAERESALDRRAVVEARFAASRDGDWCRRVLCGRPHPCPGLLGSIALELPPVEHHMHIFWASLSDPDPRGDVRPPTGMHFYGYQDTGYRLSRDKRSRSGVMVGRRKYHPNEKVLAVAWKTLKTIEQLEALRVQAQKLGYAPDELFTYVADNISAALPKLAVHQYPHAPCVIWCPRCGTPNEVRLPEVDNTVRHMP